MYGNKRVVINKRNQIIIAGEKSWIPIGICVKDGSKSIVSKFLKVEDRWDNQLTDGNSITITHKTIKDTKKAIRDIYGILD
jgi:hypothetical protein